MRDVRRDLEVRLCHRLGGGLGNRLFERFGAQPRRRADFRIQDRLGGGISYRLANQLYDRLCARINYQLRDQPRLEAQDA